MIKEKKQDISNTISTSEIVAKKEKITNVVSDIAKNINIDKALMLAHKLIWLQKKYAEAKFKKEWYLRYIHINKWWNEYFVACRWINNAPGSKKESIFMIIDFTNHKTYIYSKIEELWNDTEDWEFIKESRINHEIPKINIFLW